MSYEFTSNINPFVASGIYESMNRAYPVTREIFTTYDIGQQVSNGGNVYIAVNSGTSGGGGGPTHVSGTAADGSVTWLYVGRATTVTGAINSNLYLSLGRQAEWDDPNDPPAPDITDDGQMQVINDSTAMLLIRGSDTRLGIAKHEWVSGTVYSQYDSRIDQTSYPTPHYVIIGNSFVYKCIDNNGGAVSTSAPSGTIQSLIETADGYVWKFVGLIANSDIFQFGTTNLTPMPSAADTSLAAGQISTFVDYTDAGGVIADTDTLRVEVVGDGIGATASARTVVTGSTLTVSGIYATSPGEGYNDDTYAIMTVDGEPGSGAELEVTLDGTGVDSIAITSAGADYTGDATVIIVGDGTGATATATVLGGEVTNVVVTNAGSGYTRARAFVLPSDAGGVATAILAPGMGHGTNLRSELGTKAVLISKTLSSNFNDYIPTQSDTVDGTYRQLALVAGVISDTRNAEAILGFAHPDYNSSELVKYISGGSVIYINNIVAVTHTANQEEIVKIALTIN